MRISKKKILNNNLQASDITPTVQKNVEQAKEEPAFTEEDLQEAKEQQENSKDKSKANEYDYLDLPDTTRQIIEVFSGKIIG